MPELPPLLPESINQPTQSVPDLQTAAPKKRYRVAPLNDRVNCVIGIVVIFVVNVIGLNWMIERELRTGRSLQQFMQLEGPMMLGGMFASWLAIWTALSQSRWWVRALLFVIIAAIIALYQGLVTGTSGSRYIIIFPQFFVTAVFINAFFLILAFFRFRLTRAKRLIIDYPTDGDFVLIPARSMSAQIDAFNDWHLLRKSSASGRMDAFRPMQFHLRQIFYVSIYIALLCLVVRWTVYLFSRYYTVSGFPTDFVTNMILRLICFAAPTYSALFMLAMWVSLGKRRWLIKFLILFCITFTIIFLYKFFSTFGVTDLIVDFEQTCDSIQPFVFGFCMLSMWMIVARCFGYRLIRLPLTINEKVGSLHDPNVKSAF